MGNRVGLFCSGLALAAVGGVLVLIFYTLATLKINPALSGQEYWAVVFDRFSREPQIAAFLILSIGVTALGLCMIFRSLFWRKRERGRSIRPENRESPTEFMRR